MSFLNCIYLIISPLYHLKLLLEVNCNMVIISILVYNFIVNKKSEALYAVIIHE